MSQNFSESNLMTALAVGDFSWLMGQRESIGSEQPDRVLEDIDSCFLVIGLNETHPPQMGHGL